MPLKRGIGVSQGVVVGNALVLETEEAHVPRRTVRPEQIPEIVDSLTRLGYSERDMQSILGGNHLRVAGRVWKSSCPE